MRSDDSDKAARLQTGWVYNWQDPEGLLPWLVQPQMMGHFKPRSEKEFKIIIHGQLGKSLPSQSPSLNAHTNTY